MTYERYGRAISVQVANLKPGQFFADEPNAIVVTGLRVAFAIEKTSGSSPNTCTVSISNLTKDTRTDLQIKPLQLTLSAGYRSGPLRRLFVGDILHAPTDYDGVTPVTKIQVGDGLAAIANARLDKTYKPGAKGIDPKDLIKDLAASMGLTVPTNISSAQALLERITSGAALSGPSAKSIDALAKKYGFGWSIQDGELQTLGPNDVRSGDAIVISQATGMIDRPQYGTPTADGKPPALTVKNLLIPEALPGDVVDLQSEDINGFFKIEKLKHDGDTHGADWTTSMELVPR